MDYRTVLIADDDESFCRACARGLPPECEIVVANTLKDAIASTQTLSRQLDLAVVDLRLGADDGVTLVRAIRHECSSASIVLASAYLSVEHAERALRAGADTVMFKPFAWRDLRSRLDTLGKEDLSVLRFPDEDTPSIERIEWEHINRVLVDSGGNVSLAARRLRIYRQSLQRKLRRHAPRR